VPAVLAVFLAGRYELSSVNKGLVDRIQRASKGVDDPYLLPPLIDRGTPRRPRKDS